MLERILLTGFGGQGVMLMGELLANAAMLEGKHVTYMPSYGPEMRGGTANCSVVISDKLIASPIISEPTILVAMNEPSLDRFEDTIHSGGLLFINKSVIKKGSRRADLAAYEVDCNELAQTILNEKVANIVMLGALLKVTGVVSVEGVRKAMEQKLTGEKGKYIAVNLQALTAWKGVENN